MTETWVKLNNNANRKDTVIEISNTGKMKTKKKMSESAKKGWEKRREKNKKARGTKND